MVTRMALSSCSSEDRRTFQDVQDTREGEDGNWQSHQALRIKEIKAKMQYKVFKLCQPYSSSADGIRTPDPWEEGIRPECLNGKVEQWCEAVAIWLFDTAPNLAVEWAAAVSPLSGKPMLRYFPPEPAAPAHEDLVAIKRHRDIQEWRHQPAYEAFTLCRQAGVPSTKYVQPPDWNVKCDTREWEAQVKSWLLELQRWTEGEIKVLAQKDGKPVFTAYLTPDRERKGMRKSRSRSGDKPSNPDGRRHPEREKKGKKRSRSLSGEKPSDPKGRRRPAAQPEAPGRSDAVAAGAPPGLGGWKSSLQTQREDALKVVMALPAYQFFLRRQEAGDQSTSKICTPALGLEPQAWGKEFAKWLSDLQAWTGKNNPSLARVASGHAAFVGRSYYTGECEALQKPFGLPLPHPLPEAAQGFQSKLDETYSNRQRRIEGLKSDIYYEAMIIARERGDIHAQGVKTPDPADRLLLKKEQWSERIGVWIAEINSWGDAYHPELKPKRTGVHRG